MKSTVIPSTHFTGLLAAALLALPGSPAHAASSLNIYSGYYSTDSTGNFSAVRVAKDSGNITTWNIKAGARLTSTAASIAHGVDSYATVYLKALWTVNGNMTLGNNGHATVYIKEGGQMRPTGTANYGSHSLWLFLNNGTLGDDVDDVDGYKYFADANIAPNDSRTTTTLDMANNSNWYADEYILAGLGDATLDMKGGSLLHTHHATLAEGVGSSATVTLSGDGTQWKQMGYEDDGVTFTQGDMTVGDAGTASLTATGGADLDSNKVLLAAQSGSVGNVRLEGSGTTWKIRTDLEFGLGSADFAVRDGAVVNALSGLDLNNGANDAFSIGGLDSNDNSAATVNVASTFNLGYNGTVGMRLFEGGQLNTSGVVNIGVEGGDATVHMSDPGTRWNLGKSLSLGGGDSMGGTSTLYISDGAALNSSSVIMASTTGDDASLTLTEGSTWQLGGKAIIGYRSSAEVLITEGSQLQGDGQDVLLASNSSNATASVIIADNNSDTQSSFHSENLYIGGTASAAGGQATFRIGDNPFTRLAEETGGVVNVDGTIKVWDNGLLDMTSGSLEVGTLDIRDGFFNMDGGTLMTADVLGDLHIQGGAFGPGHSPAVTSITGNFTQGAAGTLEIELAGIAEGTFDLLNISGIADLGGMLEVTLLDDYLPEEGDLFTFLTAASVLDTFDYLILPDLPGQTEWELIYGSDSVSLGIVSAVPLPAAVWLFGTGLLGLIGFSKRKKTV
ncbi:MAG: VPLPA-CTERM sorting domain-containing protein [Candidatus Sedimenticola sp. (ex Thyasira tokunagai)]